ncbi:hypothetical protein DPMN_088274 [Dreissena polymorpha]|uniref:Uncharacterized protein n=1 Tax=Dreissena polymorpha TaxID=45954 RepID=A0A9D4KUJ2_DREPO|nr:hypothetical protein DPMN_088274 [Dreissena polymorpha]
MHEDQFSQHKAPISMWVYMAFVLQLMLKMSTTDTPLNTVALLKEKQQQEKTPYILLTGNKGFTQTMVKPKT